MFPHIQIGVRGLYPNLFLHSRPHQDMFCCSTFLKVKIISVGSKASRCVALLVVLGLKLKIVHFHARHGPFDRKTGANWDLGTSQAGRLRQNALSKRNGVILLGSRLRAHGRHLHSLRLAHLKTMGKAASVPGTHDSTVGIRHRARVPAVLPARTTWRPSPRSSAVVSANARTLANAACIMSFKLSMGQPALR